MLLEFQQSLAGSGKDTSPVRRMVRGCDEFLLEVWIRTQAEGREELVVVNVPIIMVGIGRSGVLITKFAYGFFGRTQVFGRRTNSTYEKRSERALRVGEQQRVAGIEEQRSQAQGQSLLLRLWTACRWNDSVHPQIDRHLSIMIKAMPRCHRSERRRVLLPHETVIGSTAFCGVMVAMALWT